MALASFQPFAGVREDAGARVEAIGLVELSSIARGILAADEMMKTAPVALTDSVTLSTGKYMVLVAGEVAAVEASVRKGLEVGEDRVVDHLLIAQLHHQVFPAMRGVRFVPHVNALGVIETSTVAAAIRAADAAAKAADVELIGVHLAMAIGGKGVVRLAGTVADATAAVEAGAAAAQASSALLETVVIAHPHATTEDAQA
jgi:microcompartment protein CcmL/EutN